MRGAVEKVWPRVGEMTTASLRNRPYALSKMREWRSEDLEGWGLDEGNRDQSKVELRLSLDGVRGDFSVYFSSKLCYVYCVFSAMNHCHT